MHAFFLILYAYTQLQQPPWLLIIGEYDFSSKSSPQGLSNQGFQGLIQVDLSNGGNKHILYWRPVRGILSVAQEYLCQPVSTRVQVASTNQGLLFIHDTCRILPLSNRNCGCPINLSGRTIYPLTNQLYLVGLEHVLFFHILGMSSSQLTDSYFSEG